MKIGCQIALTVAFVDLLDDLIQLDLLDSLQNDDTVLQSVGKFLSQLSTSVSLFLRHLFSDSTELFQLTFSSLRYIFAPIQFFQEINMNVFRVSCPILCAEPHVRKFSNCQLRCSRSDLVGIGINPKCCECLSIVMLKD